MAQDNKKDQDAQTEASSRLVWNNLEAMAGYKTIAWHATQGVSPWDSKLEPRAQTFVGIGVRQDGVIDAVTVRGTGAMMGMVTPEMGSAMAQDTAIAIGAVVNPDFDRRPRASRLGDRVFGTFGRNATRANAVVQGYGIDIKPLALSDVPGEVLAQPHVRDAVRGALDTVTDRKDLNIFLERNGHDPVGSPQALAFQNWVSGVTYGDDDGRAVVHEATRLERQVTLQMSPGLMDVMQSAMDPSKPLVSANYDGVLSELATRSLETSVRDTGRTSDVLVGRDVLHEIVQDASLAASDRAVLASNLDLLVSDDRPLEAARAADGLDRATQTTISGSKAMAALFVLAQEADGFVGGDRFRKSVAMMPPGVLRRSGAALIQGQETGVVPGLETLATRVALAVSVPAVDGKVTLADVPKAVREKEGTLQAALVRGAGEGIVSGYRLDSLPQRLAEIDGGMKEGGDPLKLVWNRPEEKRMPVHRRVLGTQMRAALHDRSHGNEEL